MKYKTIYADPPWWESGGGKIKRGADRHYPLIELFARERDLKDGTAGEMRYNLLWIIGN